MTIRIHMQIIHQVDIEHAPFVSLSNRQEANICQDLHVFWLLTSPILTRIWEYKTQVLNR